MSTLLLFLVLLFSFGISCWNAYVAGMIWRAAAGFMKLVAVAAIVMSVCGFIQVTAIVLGFIAVAMHWIDAKAMNALFALTYLMIIVPVLGSGLVITIHSWMEAYKRRDFSSMAVAGYNTFAQGYNTYEALDGIPSAFSAVTSFFKSNSSSDDDDSPATQVAVLLILLVAMVLAGGLTFVFFRMGRQAALPSPERMSYLQQRGRAA